MGASRSVRGIIVARWRNRRAVTVAVATACLVCFSLVASAIASARMIRTSSGAPTIQGTAGYPAAGAAVPRVGAARSPKARIRIVGGQTVLPGSWPWIAFIVNVQANFACTGMVVSTNLVLTAGHCAQDISTGIINAASGYRVVTGRTDWSDTSSGQLLGVSQVIVYPGYDRSTGDGDAALLVLASPTAAPAIPLATANDLNILAAGTTGFIAGWGATYAGDPSLPTALQAATTVVQSPAYCAQQEQADSVSFNAATAFCAINPPNFTAGTCYGDSGGPLLAARPDGTYFEMGITSRGDVNCNTSYPDVFTRVDLISPWASGWITALRPPPPASTSPPTISGSAVEGQTLLASAGTWSGTGPISFAEQWQRCGSSCSNITGATGSKYRLVAADVGRRVRVVVNASNSVGSAQATSSQFGPIAPSSAHIMASLAGQITPHGKAAGIAALIKNQGYVLSFPALSAGKVVIDWFYLPSGAHLARGKPKPVLIAEGKATFTRAGTLKVRITLTANGKRMLTHAKRLTLTVKGAFTPTAQPAVVSIKKFTLTR